ncbi:MAG TPA: ion channel [Actinophytocola sp.]|nr:ion channel [Actinophytocola sp.]
MSGRPATVTRRRFPLLAVARPLATTVALVVGYYLLPVDRALTAWTLVVLVGGTVAVVALVVWEIRRILRSPFPTLQGVQALALIVPLYLLIYANVYYVVAHNVPASFTTPLTRTDSLYFVVTVFATVGFGDIVAVTQAARVLVTAQMIGNLLLLGIALRVIVTAVQRSRARGAGV